MVHVRIFPDYDIDPDFSVIPPYYPHNIVPGVPPYVPDFEVPCIFCRCV